MTENTTPSFAAIITIGLPDSNEMSTLRVMLMPADLVPIEGKKAKPLQDCTLAELQQFAESLELKLWDQHSSATLIDLVVDGQAEVDFSFAEDDPDRSLAMDLWLEHAIVFPDGEPVVHLADESEVEQDEAASSSMSEMDSSDLADYPDIDQDIQPLDGSSEEEVIPEEIPAESAIEIDSGDTNGEAQLVGEEAATEEILDSATTSDEQTELEQPAKIWDKIVDAQQKELDKAVPVEPELRVLGLRRPLNHSTWTAVDILINEPAFRDAQAHSLSSLDKEVAGVLIGPQPEKQPDGRYLVHIVDTIIAKHTRMHGASVTYTPESWRYINDKLAERYPDESAMIVGWYHTHPGFGIFLSGMDLFIHQNFFTQAWHVAMVLDPRAHRSGFFCWDKQLSKVDPYEFPWPKWAAGSW